MSENFIGMLNRNFGMAYGDGALSENDTGKYASISSRNLQDGEIFTIDQWYRGAIFPNGSNNNTTEVRQTRLRTDTFLFPDDISVHIEPGSYKYYLAEYSGRAASTFTRFIIPSFIEEQFQFYPTNGMYYRFVIAHLDDSEIDPDEEKDFTIIYFKGV